MSNRAMILSFLQRQLLLLNFLASSQKHSHAAAAATGGLGSWDILLPNIGIVAMHVQLLNNDKVLIFDRTDFGPSNISLPKGQCRKDPKDLAVPVDCTAHSVEYDVSSNTVRPLTVLTDTWCSSGAVMPNGTFAQTGGFNDGDSAVRLFSPCSTGSCDWLEIQKALFQRRWYATNHILPDGRQIIVGGTWAFNYEFYPKSSSDTQAMYLPLLEQTHDGSIENNLYPFIFLNPNGNLFIFANNQSILFNYKNNTVVKTFPQIPGGDPRNYPSTGSAVLLPLRNLQGAATTAEVLVCGGAPKGAYDNVQNGKFIDALNTCGRIKISDPNPQWITETMPMPRIMSDMLILPNGNVLIINGASSGIAGWELGRNPVLTPIIYRPNLPNGSRFEIQNASTIPRMYHSTAVLLRDGRVLVGGSNPHEGYIFTGAFPTELRLEAFSPSYLNSSFDNLRPNILVPVSQTQVTYGQKLKIHFTVPGFVEMNLVTVTMIAPPFTTHSFSQSQRLLVLEEGNNVKTAGRSKYHVGVTIPNTSNLAPSGYYLLFVVHQDIPSKGIWIHLQ